MKSSSIHNTTQFIIAGLLFAMLWASAAAAGIQERIKFSYKKGNKHIKVIKPKYDWITSHTARRSFCTNEFLAGTPVKLIMKLSGHKKETHFYKYIRISPEEAALKIEELWNERGNMEVFGLSPQKV